MKRFDVGQVIRHTLFAIVMGVIAAFTSIVLCLCVNFCFHLMQDHHWLVFLLPLFAVLTYVVYRLFKLPFDMTTHKVVNYIRNDEGVPYTLAPGILIGTCLSTLGGASVGKEAGALHMGASLGSLVGHFFHLRTTRYAKEELKQENQEGLLNQYIDDVAPLGEGNPNSVLQDVIAIEKKNVVSQAVSTFKSWRGKAQAEHAAPDSAQSASTTDADAADASDGNAADSDTVRVRGMRGYPAALGMAATFSALFFSPIGSAFFVLELANFKLSVRKHFMSILLACFVAYFVASIFGIGDIIPKPEIPVITWHLAGQAIVIGAVCAIVGLVFVSLINSVQSISERICKNYVVWLLVGSVATVVLMFACNWFEYGGSAAPLIEVAMHGEQDPLGFAIKALLTVLALGFWLKGGEIMPTLVAGALLGASCVIITGGDYGLSAALGMIGFFAAVGRCPVASVIMACEILGWVGFPLYAITALVSTVIGRDAGLYGHGAITAAQHLLRDTRDRVKARRAQAAQAQSQNVEVSSDSK